MSSNLEIRRLPANRQRSLHWQVAKELAMEILDGSHVAEQSLPSEITLCQRFDVSRTALREAMRVLVAKSLVDARPRRGTVVRPTSDWNFLDPDVISWRAELPTVTEFLRELHELRFTIEPAAAALMAARGAEADIERLRQAFNKLVDACKTADTIQRNWVDNDIAFHEIILESCGNQLFASMRAAVSQALRTSIEVTLVSPEAPVSALPTHRAVLEAIELRDRGLAQRSMYELLAATEQDIENVLPSLPVSVMGDNRR